MVGDAMTTKPTGKDSEHDEAPYRSFRLGRAKSPQVGVPRRFGIGTMMVFTAMFAVLFSVLKTLNVSPAPFVFISVFVAGVAACQAILFGGKNPRAASIAGGSVLYYLMMVVVYLYSGSVPGAWPKESLFSLPGIFALLLAGAWAGYAAGILAAAIFLVWKEPDDGAPPPNDAENASHDTAQDDSLPSDGEAT
jgi:hypothetical protein